MRESLTVAPALCHPGGKSAVACVVLGGVQCQGVKPNGKGQTQGGVKREGHEVPAVQPTHCRQ